MDDSTLFVIGMVISIFIICITFIILEVLKRKCVHTWETVEIKPVYDAYEDRTLSQLPIFTKATLRCSKCGEMKCVKLGE